MRIRDGRNNRKARAESSRCSLVVKSFIIMSQLAPCTMAHVSRYSHQKAHMQCSRVVFLDAKCAYALLWLGRSFASVPMYAELELGADKLAKEQRARERIANCPRRQRAKRHDVYNANERAARKSLGSLEIEIEIYRGVRVAVASTPRSICPRASRRTSLLSRTGLSSRAVN